METIDSALVKIGSTVSRLRRKNQFELKERGEKLGWSVGDDNSDIAHGSSGRDGLRPPLTTYEYAPAEGNFRQASAVRAPRSENPDLGHPGS